MSSLKSRVLVAVIGVPVLVAIVLWAPDVVIMVALALLAAIGGIELQQCVSGEKKSVLIGLSAVVAGLTVVCYYLWPQYAAMMVMAVVVLLFGYAIVKGGEVKFAQIMAGIFGSFAIGYSFASFIRLEAYGLPRFHLLLPFILSFACDTFAYIVGCSIGKHKLAPKVSPKKSVEGAIGGILGNMFCGLLFVWVTNRWFVSSYFGYGEMALLALLCSIAAQIGDLSFSLIKREFGIKDYGKLFLAHGGVLDRFDSVLFVAPLMEIFLITMVKLIVG